MTFPRKRLHRRIFVAAGLYNLGWGAVTVLAPGWFFALSGMPAPRYPEIVACLGMVIGLYGIVYLEVARRPEDGFVLAAVGLVGKVLGPLGAGVLVARGAWPLRAALIVCVTNDAIWWGSFALYLRDTWPVSGIPRPAVAAGSRVR